METQYLNKYECPKCKQRWADVWDSACDDDCSVCGERHISPYYSEEVTDEAQTNPALNHLKDYYLILQVMANTWTSFAVKSESTRASLRNLISEIEGKDVREVQEETETEAYQQVKLIGVSSIQKPVEWFNRVITNILKHGKE